MASAHEEQYAVFLGNLDDSGSEQDVATMISRLIWQASGLRVGSAGIHVKHSELCRCYTAYVSFSSQADQHKVLWTLQNIPAFPYGLLKEGRKRRVDIYEPRLTEILPGILSEQNTNGYISGQQLGNETRTLEFKRGGGDLRRLLDEHLAKYSCAFLNSQGGTLMFGVDDEGVVQGVHCDRQQEDQLRIQIDDIIQKLDPPVLPPMYQVQFKTVRDQAGYISDLKVIEIQVNHSGRPDTLYETQHGKAFIRRDGSVRGPLRSKEIQEWCRLKYVHNSVQSGESSDLQNQVDQLQERLQKVESNIQELDSTETRNVKRSKSTVCTIL